MNIHTEPNHTHDGHAHSNTHHQTDHPHPRYSAESHAQHVVLDIGDDIGALIVHANPELLGTEVEISPAGRDDERSHKEVLERNTGSRSEHVLVFDNLPEGEYTLWIDNVARNHNVRVAGGAISEVELSHLR